MIAQEVKGVIDQLGTDFAGYVDPNVKREEVEAEASTGEVPEQIPLGLNYIEFVAPLIKAVQELGKEVDSLQAQVLALEEGA